MSTEDKFQIIITDTDGRITLEIMDFNSGTKCSILDEQEFEELAKKAGSIAWMCRFIINKLKPGYREIVKR